MDWRKVVKGTRGLLSFMIPQTAPCISFVNLALGARGFGIASLGSIYIPRVHGGGWALASFFLCAWGVPADAVHSME